MQFYRQNYWFYRTFFYVFVSTAMSMGFRRHAQVLINWHRIGLLRALIDAVIYRILHSSIFLLLVVPFAQSYGACPCTYTPALLIEAVDGDTVWYLVEGEEIRVQFA